MPKKQLTNLGVLMDLLNISTVELSKAIAIERSSISKWRHGATKILADMPYFEELVSYMVQKNKRMGNELLENFFESVYPVKKRLHKEYLKRCIRAYLLDIPDAKVSDTAAKHQLSITNTNTSMIVTKQTGATGRLEMFIGLLTDAEKLTEPSVIRIFEAEQLEWISCNMHNAVTFYQKIKSVLNAGHKIEFIFQVRWGQVPSLELHQIFLELIFHEKLSVFVFTSKANKNYIGSMYILSGHTAVFGFYFDDNLDNMLSYQYTDKQLIVGCEAILEKYKETAPQVIVTNKRSDWEKMLNNIHAVRYRSGAYFQSGKSLCLCTMSKALLDEILEANNLTNERKQLCYDFYYTFREIVECCAPDPASGFYYILDEITAPLAYPVITNYVLSAITGRLVQMSRTQYMQHFKDTAEILLAKKEYRVLLHHTAIPTIVPISYPKSVWYKNDCWTLAINTDSYSGKTKFVYGENMKTSNVFECWFLDILEKIPEHKKDNAFVADLFMKIANGQKV